MSTDVNTAYHRRSAAPSNEYRSFPVRSVKPTHDGRSVEGAGGASSSVSGGAGLDSTRRPSDATTSATPVVAPLNQPTVVPLPVVEQQPRAHGTPRGDSPYRGSTGVEDESRRQATPRRQQAVQIINLENFEAFPNANVKTIFNSPRSLSVCAEHGIHATELLPRAPQDFLSTAVPETIAAMRYHHFEARRQEKLALLRAARADAIHAAAVAAAAELVRELDATEHEDDANATAQVVTRAAVVPSASFLRTPARIGTSTPPATVRAAVSRRPVLSSGGSTTNTALRHDPTVLVERASKRELVYERAMKLRLEQEQRVIQNQIQAEQRAVSHRKACEEEKARVIELRRLKWGDAREEIEHKRRQREYQERRRREQFIASNGSIPFRRSSSCSQPASSQQATTTTTSSRTNQHVDVTATVFADLSYTGVLQERRNQQRAWDVQLAKEQYFTPRQRAEKVRRASSAHAAV
ncbi:Hypothetical protein, putative [Bodo saltans]|uniref:Uncharacterized protein n=1 Tax=Bodo saltans TaxID=75058 RepID=A0A0S4JTY3_BODSA|nr:Hypothetical protein, putative [Bodo saltans]|eukprot:CUG93852.1 Hypothetical protein, putative [Bodo saltans]